MFVLISTTTVNAEAKVSLLRRIFTKLTWEEIETIVDTPKEICAAIRHTVDYKEDFGDEWTAANETWNRGYGDCEDFAIAVLELCKKKGIKADIQVFYPNGSIVGHAVVIGEWKGKMWISSNGWFQYVKSIEHAKKEIKSEIGWKQREILMASI